MKEQIDILLATYNGEKYIREQIESILNQTHYEIRLVISDDKSQDRTCEILKEYEERDSRVRVYYQEKNLGYIRNFEFLLKQVENNVFMLSDQDDVWLPEKVEKSYETLREENADLVFGDLTVVDEKLNTIYESFGDFMKLNRKIKKCIGSYEGNYLYNCVTGCTIMSKRKYIEKILPIPYQSKYVAHDHWIALVVSLNGKLAYMPEKYILYRQHGNNEIGTDKISHGFRRLEQVRELFVQVKLGVFGTYVTNESIFPEEIRGWNRRALLYYRMIHKKKYANFRGWKLFHRLYRNETLLYYVENFFVLNFPFIAKGLFCVRYWTLKLVGKR